VTPQRSSAFKETTSGGVSSTQPCTEPGRSRVCH
jgi:hypothetical protein